jgi:hypothetical protein
MKAAAADKKDEGKQGATQKRSRSALDALKDAPSKDPRTVVDALAFLHGNAALTAATPVPRKQKPGRKPSGVKPAAGGGAGAAGH